MSTMSEAAAVEKKLVSGPAALGGLAVLVALVAAGVGFHAKLLPAPVMEGLTCSASAGAGNGGADLRLFVVPARRRGDGAEDRGTPMLRRVHARSRPRA